MDTLLKADIFFIITSVAVVIVTLFFCAALYQLMKVFKHVKIISQKIESNVDNVSEDVRDAIQQMSGSPLFNFIFRKSRKREK